MPQTQRVTELEALFHLTDDLYRAGSLSDVYDAAFKAILTALRCDRASILLFDQAGVMRFVAWRGLSEAYRNAVDGHSPWRVGDRGVAPIFVEDIDLADEPETLKTTIKTEGIRSLAFIPLTSSGAVVGKFMTYYEEPHVFTEDEADLALTIARQLGFSLERNRAEAARAVAEEGLRRSRERLRLIFDSASEYAIITLDDQARITNWNSGAERLLGYQEADALGQSGEIFFTPEDRAAAAPEEEMLRAREEGRAANERWHMRKDGSRFWGSGVMLPIVDGGPDAYLKIFRDRTAERQAEQRQEVLVGELNHRVKNTLATVQSLAEQTLKSARDPQSFVAAFNRRLLALSEAHDLLTRENWESVELADLALAVLRVWIEEGRVTIAGPRIHVGPKRALALSMAFNELTTNAVKYGALSVPGGDVVVSWECAGDCTIRWVERGGPPVAKPTREGFGMRVLNRALAAELGRPVELAFEPHGVSCLMRIIPFHPLPQAADRPAQG